MSDATIFTSVSSLNQSISGAPVRQLPPNPWWVPAHATGWTAANEKFASSINPITLNQPVSSTPSTQLTANQQFPSFKQMAFNLATSVNGVFINAAVTGNLLISDEIADNRMNTCNECEFFYKPSLRCTKCGCFMATKVKLIASKCPVGKWIA